MKKLFLFSLISFSPVFANEVQNFGKQMQQRSSMPEIETSFSSLTNNGGSVWHESARKELSAGDAFLKEEMCCGYDNGGVACCLGLQCSPAVCHCIIESMSDGASLGCPEMTFLLCMSIPISLGISHSSLFGISKTLAGFKKLLIKND